MKLLTFVKCGPDITSVRSRLASPYICGLKKRQPGSISNFQNASLMTMCTSDHVKDKTVRLRPSMVDIQAQTIEWVQNFVIKLNLCPFAEQVLREGTQRIVVSPASTSRVVWEAVKMEIQHLLSVSMYSVSTTLLVFPHFAEEDFLTFHQVCTEMEDEIENDDSLVDEVMLAYFHPLHTWADANGVDDAINFDKRSPFPIINLLRAPQVDEYIEQGRTQGIVDRNREMLERLGNINVKRLFTSLSGYCPR